MRQLRSNLIRSAALPVDLGLYVPVVFELPHAWSAHCTMPATMLHVPPAVDLNRGGGSGFCLEWKQHPTLQGRARIQNVWGRASPGEESHARTDRDGCCLEWNCSQNLGRQALPREEACAHGMAGAGSA